MTEVQEVLQQPHNTDDIRRVDKKCVDYLLPYLLHSAGKVAYRAAQAGRITTDYRLENDWTSNQANYRNMITSRESLQRFIRLPEIAPRATLSKFKTLIDDYASMIEDARIIGLDLQSRLQQQANTSAIEETQRGLTQGESVRRLTLVAFVFIPLNFATSFFGMNFHQLGTGSLNLGWFFLLAALAGILSFVLSVSIRPLDGLWQRARQHHADMEIIYDKDAIKKITKRQILLGFLHRPIKFWCLDFQDHLMQRDEFHAY